MKKNKFILFIILFSLTSFLQAVPQGSNPFLSGKKMKQGLDSTDKRTILIVFDASGSMEEKIRGETKIHIAKRVLENVLLKADANINIGLRVYGLSKSSGNPYIDCTDSKLIVLPGTENRRLIVSEIYKILPQGFTPITYSLSQGIQDLLSYKGEKSIILISDGLETCGGNPCQLAHDINVSNIDLKIDVVGFGIKQDWVAEEQLMCIATNTHGRYFSAESAEDLASGLNESINKSVTGRIITMLDKPVEVKSEETEGYEKLPILTPEKLIIKKKTK